MPVFKPTDSSSMVLQPLLGYITTSTMFINSVLMYVMVVERNVLACLHFRTDCNILLRWHAGLDIFVSILSFALCFVEICYLRFYIRSEENSHLGSALYEFMLYHYNILLLLRWCILPVILTSCVLTKVGRPRYLHLTVGRTDESLMVNITPVLWYSGACTIYLPTLVTNLFYSDCRGLYFQAALHVLLYGGVLIGLFVGFLLYIAEHTNLNQSMRLLRNNQSIATCLVGIAVPTLISEGVTTMYQVKQATGCYARSFDMHNEDNRGGGGGGSHGGLIHFFVFMRLVQALLTLWHFVVFFLFYVSFRKKLLSLGRQLLRFCFCMQGPGGPTMENGSNFNNASASLLLHSNQAATAAQLNLVGGTNGSSVVSPVLMQQPSSALHEVENGRHSSVISPNILTTHL